MESNSFRNLTGKVLYKYPGTIGGQDFYLENLSECKVYLVDPSSRVLISGLRNCSVYMGPVFQSCEISDSSGCSISVATRELKISQSNNLKVFLFSQSTPQIERSEEISLGPYNFSYPNQTSQFFQVGLDPVQGFTDYNTDFVNGPFKILQPSEFFLEVYRNEEIGEPENPVITPSKFKQATVKEAPKEQDLMISNLPRFQIDEPQILYQNPEKQQIVDIPIREIEQTNLQIGDVKKIVYYYQHEAGFVQTCALSEFPNNILNNSLQQLNEIVKPYNLQLRTLSVGWIFAIASFFLLLLYYIFLRLISHQTPGGDAFNIIFCAVWIIALATYLIIRRKRIISESAEELTRFNDEQNNQYYNQRRAHLIATLDTFEVQVQ